MLCPVTHAIASRFDRQRWNAFRFFLAACLTLLLLVGSLAAFSVWYLAQPDPFVVLFGDSMTPTLSSFDVVYFRHVALIQRGDVANYFGTCHRVVILPGETFRVASGIVYLEAHGHERALNEPYVVYQYAWDWPRTTLSPDEYVLLGDNRTNPQARYPLVAQGQFLTRVLDRRAFPPWKRQQFD